MGGFAARLERYLSDVMAANTESSRAYLFLEFLRGTFSSINSDYLEQLYPQLERAVKVKKATIIVKGRADVILGNLIMEFKDELTEKKET